jgi:guanylate kinase
MTAIQDKMQNIESAIFILKVALTQMTDINFGRKDDDPVSINRMLESAKVNIEGSLL